MHYQGTVEYLDEMAKQLFVQFAHLSCLALNAHSRPSSTITRCYYEKNAPTSAIILCLLSDLRLCCRLMAAGHKTSRLAISGNTLRLSGTSNIASYAFLQSIKFALFSRMQCDDTVVNMLPPPENNNPRVINTAQASRRKEKFNPFYQCYQTALDNSLQRNNPSSSDNTVLYAIQVARLSFLSLNELRH